MAISLDEVLDVVRKRRGWRLDGGAIRRYGPKGEQQCPVSSILERPIGYYRGVARFIGLSMEAADAIAKAADDDKRCDQVLRLMLLDACGLTADKPSTSRRQQSAVNCSEPPLLTATTTACGLVEERPKRQKAEPETEDVLV